MATVARRLSVQMAQLPVLVRRTLTWDRGMELAGHKEVTAATGLAVYFADPRSPWQRGTNENTNRLLRQYLPKGVSMAGLTQDDLDQIAAWCPPALPCSDWSVGRSSSSREPSSSWTSFRPMARSRC
jgi:IS30 family transposase